MNPRETPYSALIYIHSRLHDCMYEAYQAYQAADRPRVVRECTGRGIG
jgi:hypothetical protein